MSRTLLFIAGYLLALLLMCAACNKKSDSDCDGPWACSGDSTSVVGTWELSTGFNGQGGVEHYSPGNGRRLEFTDNTFKSYMDGQLLRQGQYIIFPDSFRILGGVRNRIVFNNETDFRQSIRNTGSKLYLEIDANDGPGAEYTRMRQ